jgi:hypothetical protein
MTKPAQPDLFGRLLKRETGPYHRWNVIPNRSVLASYSFTTQSIELSDIDSKMFQQALEGNVVLQRRISVLLAHEVRHWLDHIGSLWGQTSLCLGYNALHARHANNPYELWRVAASRHSGRDARFERYYSTVECTAPRNGVQHWKYMLSAVARFDHLGKIDENHPILFTRFSWTDDTSACRAPISVASLLETGAVDFEYQAEHAFLYALPAEDRNPASERLQRRFLESVYDPELVEYSVAVHGISNLVKTKSISESYELSSALASVVLNLTPEHFSKLRIPTAFEKWGARNEAFLKNADRGYAFLALAHHAPKAPVADVDNWLARTLDAAALPQLEQIKKDAREAMGQLRGDLLDGPFAAICNRHLDVGSALFEDHGPVFRFKEVFERLGCLDFPLPPILLGGDLTVAGNGVLEDWSVSPIYAQMDQMYSAYTACDEFLDACGV